MFKICFTKQVIYIYIYNHNITAEYIYKTDLDCGIKFIKQLL